MFMTNMEIIILISGILALISLYSSKYRCHTTSPVLGFDVNKYLGKWYEIARMPNRFENELVNVTATYSLRKDGKIKVVNEGYKVNPNGKHKIAEGKAKFAGDPTIGYLRVSFFWFFYSDYIIVDLDSNYQYAMVVSGKNLWILSRAPHLDKSIWEPLLQKAITLGYDTSKIYFTPQNW
ncbi:MAG: lipocalin family protein [Candidatus Omnitrophota bacterium]